MASVWNCRHQHSGVSAGLEERAEWKLKGGRTNHRQREETKREISGRVRAQEQREECGGGGRVGYGFTEPKGHS